MVDGETHNLTATGSIPVLATMHPRDEDSVILDARQNAVM